MNRKHLYIFIVAGAVFGFFYFQESFAKIAWQKYRNAEIAIFLTKDAKLAMLIGNYYFNGGEYDLDKAVKAYQKAIRLDGKILWGHYQFARIYFVKGDKVKALSEINKELEANPENLRSLYVRGLIYGYWPDLPKAEADFKRFVAWSPTEWAGWNDLAWILAKQEKYEEVENTINIAMQKVSQADKNVWLLNSLGVAQLNLKKYKEAEMSFRKAKELAELLTLEEWKNAYPGNSPATAEQGLESFRRAVDFNLEKSRVK